MTARLARPARPAALAALTVLALAPTLPAAAQMRCGQRDAIVRQLATRYGETQRSVGFQQGRGVVEIYVNADSGSWTILLTTPEGMSCLMAAGEAFQAFEARKADTPA